MIEENLTQSNSKLYDSYSGIACFIDNHTLETNDNHILNANTIYTKTSAMQKPFDHIAILGGDVMGLECANLYSRYGSQVTIFERNYRILEIEHPNTASMIQRNLEDQEVKFHLGTQVTAIQNQNNQVDIYYTQNNTSQVSSFDAIVLASNKPDTSDMILGVLLQGNHGNEMINFMTLNQDSNDQDILFSNPSMIEVANHLYSNI